jgi:hypothetical protein
MMNQVSTAGTKYPDPMLIWHPRNASFAEQRNKLFQFIKKQWNITNWLHNFTNKARILCHTEINNEVWENWHICGHTSSIRSADTGIRNTWTDIGKAKYEKKGTSYLKEKGYKEGAACHSSR